MTTSATSSSSAISPSMLALLNGTNGKHGINHLIEIFQMLPDGPSAEFRIKE